MPRVAPYCVPGGVRVVSISPCHTRNRSCLFTTEASLQLAPCGSACRYTTPCPVESVEFIAGAQPHVVRRRSDPSLTPARIAKVGASPLRASSVKKASSLFVKPSPTSTLPRVVSANLLNTISRVEGALDVKETSSMIGSLCLSVLLLSQATGKSALLRSNHNSLRHRGDTSRASRRDSRAPPLAPRVRPLGSVPLLELLAATEGSGANHAVHGHDPVEMIDLVLLKLRKIVLHPGL